jgi:hypothetical protein
VEVARKVVLYTLGKPSKEILFTLATQQELAAKVVIDSLVGRAADVLAAAIFHVLGALARFRVLWEGKTAQAMQEQ